MRNRKRKRIVWPVLLLGCFGLCLVIGYSRNRLFRYNSPGELAEAAVRGYQSQNNTLLEACYGKSPKQLQGDKEINFQKKFYLSVDAKEVNINKTEKLFSMGGYYCMGVSFDFLLGGRESIPCYEYYFVHKTGGNYKLLTKLECPRVLMDAFEEKKDSMQESDLYRKYKKQTMEFTSGHPSCAEQIYGRFQDLLEGPPAEMVKNLRLVCGVFVMAIAELGVVCALIYLFKLMKRLQNAAGPLSGKSKSNRTSGKSGGRRLRSKYFTLGAERSKGRQRANRTPVKALRSAGNVESSAEAGPVRRPSDPRRGRRSISITSPSGETEKPLPPRGGRRSISITSPSGETEKPLPPRRGRRSISITSPLGEAEKPPHPHAGRRSRSRSGRASIFDSRKDNIPHTGTHA